MVKVTYQSQVFVTAFDIKDAGLFISCSFNSLDFRRFKMLLTKNVEECNGRSFVATRMPLSSLPRSSFTGCVSIDECDVFLPKMCTLCLKLMCNFQFSYLFRFFSMSIVFSVIIVLRTALHSYKNALVILHIYFTINRTYTYIRC